MGVIASLVGRFTDFVERTRMRLARDPVDVLTDSRDGWQIFWPIHKDAERVIREQVPSARRMRGGYAVPREHWKEAYDAIHHNGCPLMATVCSFAVMIDTP